MFFPLISVIPLNPLAGSKAPEKTFEFLKIIFPEITLWNVTITSFA